MRRITPFILLFFLASCSLFVDPDAARHSTGEGSGDPGRQQGDLWVTAYMGSWNHYAPPGGNWGNLPTEEIDWDAFTHLIYFAVTANPDGTLSPIKKYHNLSPSRVRAIVSAGHENDTPVLFSVGGWGNYPGFRSAIMPENRDRFISSLLEVLDRWGFDGIDLDMEPIKDETDVRNYKAFARELHRRLQKRSAPTGTRPYLTAATGQQPAMFGALHEIFDQINLMTYDMSGSWRGWVSWHNAPVYNGGNTFPGTGKPMPSANRMVEEFTSAGVPREKLGIGIDFYGYIWRGYVIKPLQSWNIRPSVKPNVPYFKIMEEHYDRGQYHWDDQAKAAYLSIDSPIPLKKRFISFDDERSIEAKFDYVREKGIGGLIIWELTGGYRKDQPEGQKDRLLQKVKEEWNGN